MSTKLRTWLLRIGLGLGFGLRVGLGLRIEFELRLGFRLKFRFLGRFGLRAQESVYRLSTMSSVRLPRIVTWRERASFSETAV